MAKEKDKKGKKLLITPKFVLSFPHLWKAQAAEEGATKKFSCQALFNVKKFDADDKEKWAAIEKAMNRVVKEATGKSIDAQKPKFKRGFRDGSEEKPELSGYKGMTFISLSSTKKIGVVDRDGNAISPEEGNEDMIYPGAVCRAAVNPYYYKKAGNEGVSLGMNALRFVKNGPRIDDGVDAEEAFAGIEEESESESESESEENGKKKKKKKKAKDSESESESESEAPKKKKKKKPEPESESESESESEAPKKKGKKGKKPKDSESESESEDL